jgi:hypothetical protein
MTQSTRPISKSSARWSLATLVALAPLAVAACGGGKGARKPRPEDLIGADPLPLAAGAAWKYKATVTSYDVDKQQEVKRDLDWTTQIIDVKPSDGVTAYTVRGWPSDLADAAEGTPKATDRVLLRAGDSFMWATEGTSVEGAQGWFTWPLMEGQQICPDPGVTYCWNVASTEDGYQLTYRTGPDEEVYLLQPGTGVAYYRYTHHGTINDVEAKLVDYKPGKK